ncbi:hypothetical protein Dimus_000120 [Dionaea muscipula]
MLSSLVFTSFTTHNLSPFSSPKSDVGTSNSRRLCFSARSQGLPSSGNGGKEGRRGVNQDKGNQRVWRRRKLTKRDVLLDNIERIPFLEESARKVKESGALLAVDINRLMLSEENRYDFVNELAAEAKEYQEKNPDEYGHKKAILHVLSDRMNADGFHRDEAYLDLEAETYKRGRGFVRKNMET